jgi:hypothetical protein
MPGCAKSSVKQLLAADEGKLQAEIEEYATVQSKSKRPAPGFERALLRG